MVELSQLHNTYFGLRHGESEANELGIIASGPKAIDGYGLTQKGKEQVRLSILAARDAHILDEKTILVISPLRRAKESAAITAEVLGIPQEQQISFADIREREFGPYEGLSHEHYKQSIWPIDPHTPERTDGVETVNQVRDRMLGVIEQLENTYNGRTILFVGHGDPLQILQTWFANIPSEHHRTLEPMENAALRRYN